MRTLTEYISELLSNTKLFEMAYERKRYLEILPGLFHQVIENWCLIKYARLYNSQCTTINHWKVELDALLSDLQTMKLKNANKLKTTRFHVIGEAEYDRHDFSRLLKGKFTNEGIWNAERAKIIVQLFHKDVEKICTIIASTNPNDIDKYIDNL